MRKNTLRNNRALRAAIGAVLTHISQYMEDFNLGDVDPETIDMRLPLPYHMADNDGPWDIIDSFRWVDTKEGYQFWKEVYTTVTHRSRLNDPVLWEIYHNLINGTAIPGAPEPKIKLGQVFSGLEVDR